MTSTEQVIQLVLDELKERIIALSNELDKLYEEENDLINAWCAEVDASGGKLWLSSEEGLQWLQGEGKVGFMQYKAAEAEVQRRIERCLEEQNEHYMRVVALELELGKYQAQT